MTKYYEKELNVKDQKKSVKFAEEVEKVTAEAKKLKEQKELSKARIPEIKRLMSILVTDVDVITNPIKRMKVLSDKKKLQEELDEQELFAVMNVEVYRSNKLQELYDLGEEANREYSRYVGKADELLEQLKKEFEEKKQEILTARSYSHPFYKHTGLVMELRGRKLKAKEQKEKEEKDKKTIHVDADGNEIIGSLKDGTWTGANK